jgi:hypothetical protein
MALAPALAGLEVIEPVIRRGNGQPRSRQVYSYPKCQ